MEAHALTHDTRTKLTKDTTKHTCTQYKDMRQQTVRVRVHYIPFSTLKRSQRGNDE